MLTQEQMLDFTALIAQFGEADPVAYTFLQHAEAIGIEDRQHGRSPVDDHLFQALIIGAVLIQLGHEDDAKKVYTEALEVEQAEILIEALLSGLV